MSNNPTLIDQHVELHEYLIKERAISAKLQRDRDVMLTALLVLSADECAGTFVCASLEPEGRCSSCIARAAIAQVRGGR